MRYTRDLHAYTRMVYDTGKPFLEFGNLPRMPLFDDYLPEEVYWNNPDVEESGILDSGLVSRIKDEHLSRDLKVLDHTKKKVNEDNPKICVTDVLERRRDNGEAFLMVYVGPKYDPRTDSMLSRKVIDRVYEETDSAVRKALNEYLDLLKSEGLKVKTSCGRSDFFELIEQKMSGNQ